MRRSLILTAATLVLLLSACQDASQPVAPSDPTVATSAEPTFSLFQEADRVMPGRILARLAPGADPETVGQAHGVAFERLGPKEAFALFRGAVGNERALAARMRGDTRVVWAEPDYLRQPHSIRPELWAFYNPGGLAITYTTGRNKGNPVASFLSFDDADEDNIEGYGGGGVAVSIASIDTGVDFLHPEFTGVPLIKGEDFYSGDADPSDTDGHGTHTTGTMVGQTVGVAGVAGAADKVTVYVYRVCGPLGCPTSAIVSAIYAAADAHVVAMNLSLGGSVLAPAEALAIDYATALGALVIASAGNGGTGTVSYPARYPKAIAVAASNWQDGLAYYSNWGENLDITAPGGQMYSNTSPESGIYSSVPGGFAYYQGTSMAAPQVTGTAAVVASVLGLRGDALWEQIRKKVDDLGATGYDTQYGYGRLNSYRAVTNTTLNEDTPPSPTALTAAFTYSCPSLTCNFDGSSSTGASTWGWAADDGWSDSGVVVSHSFDGVGTYTVTLRVGDDNGAIASTSKTITCTALNKRKIKCQ